MKPLTFTQAPNVFGHNFKMLATKKAYYLQKYSRLSTKWVSKSVTNIDVNIFKKSDNFTVNTESVNSFLNSYSLLECSFVPFFFNEGKILNWPRFRTKYACISAKNLLEKYVMQIKVNFIQI